MNDESLRTVMVLMAVATPGLALLIVVRARRGSIHRPPRGRLLLLTAAGPANLFLWEILHASPETKPIHPAFAIAAAVLVFVALGLGTGFLRKRDRREATSRPAPRQDE